MIIYFGGRGGEGKEGTIYKKRDKIFISLNQIIGLDVQNVTVLVFEISFIDDAASRQLFRGDLQRARRTLSSPMPLLLIVPSRLRNGRQRGGGGVTPNKAAEIRKTGTTSTISLHQTTGNAPVSRE